MDEKLKHGGSRTGAGRPRKIKTDILSVAKIIDIIDVCKSTNIKSLKYGPLELEFCEVSAAYGETRPFDVETVQSTDDEDTTKTLEEDARLTQLMIDDPAGFEQEVIDSKGWLNAEA